MALLNAMLIGLDWYCNARALLFAHHGARALIHAPDRFDHSHSSRMTELVFDLLHTDTQVKISLRTLRS